MFGNLKSNIEKFDVQEISESARHQKPRSLFYLWFGSNLTVADFIIGSDYLLGSLSNLYMIIALVIANAGGAALLAFMSVLGPLKGRSQMALSEGAYGVIGGKAMSLLQFINTGGWLTVNLIIASQALLFLMSSGATQGFGSNLLFDLFAIGSIIIVSLVVFLLAFFGHSIIKMFETVMSVVLGLMFTYIILNVLIFHMSDVISQSNSVTTFSWISFGTVIMLSFSYIMSWGPYASDYSRYIPRSEKLLKSFFYTFFGGFLASIGAEFAGLLAAYVLGTGSGSDSIFFPVLGSLWFIGPIALLLGGIAANSLNLYSNFLSLKTIVTKASKLPIIIIVSLASIVMAIIFYGDFSGFYETFLYILDYWITPWIGVMIAEFIITKAGDHGTKSITWSILISYLLSIAVSYPFMNTIEYYLGTPIPFYTLLGGVDISYIVSFFSAIVLTILVERFVFKRTNILRGQKGVGA